MTIKYGEVSFFEVSPIVRVVLYEQPLVHFQGITQFHYYHRIIIVP